MSDEPTQHYEVILSTADGAVHECELDALDAVMAAVIARARYTEARITHVHARLVSL